MSNRSTLTAAVAIAATLASGGFAVAATTVGPTTLAASPTRAMAPAPGSIPAPAPTPPQPAVDCHGSDDGMTEAEKKARERTCDEPDDD